MPCKREAVQIINMPIPPTFSVCTAASRSALSQGDSATGISRGRDQHGDVIATDDRPSVGAASRS
jgi:hypothetical protein